MYLIYYYTETFSVEVLVDTLVHFHIKNNIMAQVTCSFCGRNKKDVDLMISGIHAHICDKCITQAQSNPFRRKKSNTKEMGHQDLI